jgi:signal transduction histidine kinase
VEFALPALVAEVVSELEPLADRAGLVVSSDVPSVLPPLASDRQKVKQILVNLLANAIKFTPKGTVRLRARYMRSADRITIQVIDTGVGIAIKDQERVFDMFQQADASTTRSFGGTGLGLAICTRLSTMLGGRITLQSEPGKGSTFTVTLPRKARTP